jgi:hypothetical protein
MSALQVEETPKLGSNNFALARHQFPRPRTALRAWMALWSYWRTIRPAGIPVLREVSASQAASSSVRRMLIV